MEKYEITFLTADEKSEGIKKVQAEIERLGGEIVENTTLNRRVLAYPIKKHNQAVYTVLGFNFEKENYKELRAALQLEPEILRFLVVDASRITKMEFDEKEGARGKGYELREEAKKEEIEKPREEPKEEIKEPVPVKEIEEIKEVKKESSVAKAMEDKKPVKKPVAIADDKERLRKLDEELAKLLQE